MGCRVSQLDLQEICDQVPFHRLLGLQVRRTEEGVTFDADVGPDFVLDTDSGIIHGGIVGSLLDTAATFALIAATNHDWVTVDLRVDYLRPARGGALTIDGDVVRAGRTIGRAGARLRDGSDSLCAIALGTFAPSRAEKGS
jgi:uncharacterized protein (TIGR00369 family)